MRPLWGKNVPIQHVLVEAGQLGSAARLLDNVLQQLDRYFVRTRCLVIFAFPHSLSHLLVGKAGAGPVDALDEALEHCCVVLASLHMECVGEVADNRQERVASVFFGETSGPGVLGLPGMMMEPERIPVPAGSLSHVLLPGCMFLLHGALVVLPRLGCLVDASSQAELPGGRRHVEARSLPDSGMKAREVLQAVLVKLGRQ